MQKTLQEGASRGKNSQAFGTRAGSSQTSLRLLRSLFLGKRVLSFRKHSGKKWVKRTGCSVRSHVFAILMILLPYIFWQPGHHEWTIQVWMEGYGTHFLGVCRDWVDRNAQLGCMQTTWLLRQRMSYQSVLYSYNIKHLLKQCYLQYKLYKLYKLYTYLTKLSYAFVISGFKLLFGILNRWDLGGLKLLLLKPKAWSSPRGSCPWLSRQGSWQRSFRNVVQEYTVCQVVCHCMSL